MSTLAELESKPDEYKKIIEEWRTCKQQEQQESTLLEQQLKQMHEQQKKELENKEEEEKTDNDKVKAPIQEQIPAKQSSKSADEI